MPDLRIWLRIHDRKSKQGRQRRKQTNDRTIPILGPDEGSVRMVPPKQQQSIYRNPFRSIKNLTPERIDMGVDYSGSGPFYPVGTGVITNLYNSGWPGGGFISYRLTDGPDAGKYVYVAEDVTPARGINIGSKVTPNTVIGYLNNYLETGWAAPPGTGNALGAPDFTGSNATPAGVNFNKLLVSTGTPSGTIHGKAPPPDSQNINAQTTDWRTAIINGILGVPADIGGGLIGAGISAGIEEGVVNLFKDLFQPLLKRLWWFTETSAGALGIFLTLIMLVVAGLIKGVESTLDHKEILGAMAAAPETGGASLALGTAYVSRKERQARQEAQLNQSAQRIVIAGARQGTAEAREARLAKESDAALARSQQQVQMPPTPPPPDPEREKINAGINARLARIQAEAKKKGKK